jgi:thiamine biosynthesis protein ThiI
MHYILRFGEITLKGKNRPFFERKLRSNIERMFGGCHFTMTGGRFYVESRKEIDLRRVFGIVSYSPAEKVSRNYEEIEKEVLRFAEGHKGTFRMECHRLDKRYGKTSMEMNRELGSAVVEMSGLEVDLDNPDLTIGVEIMKNAAYVYSETIRCFGGLPVGVEGNVAALIEDEASLLAALLVMKRGCDVLSFGTKSQDVSLLEYYGCNNDFRIVESVKVGAEEAEGSEARALVVGDTLKSFKEYDVDIPVLRPLVGFDEKEIEELLEEYCEGSH